jgi:hypothetical protein
MKQRRGWEWNLPLTIYPTSRETGGVHTGEQFTWLRPVLLDIRFLLSGPVKNESFLKCTCSEIEGLSLGQTHGCDEWAASVQVGILRSRAEMQPCVGKPGCLQAGHPEKFGGVGC